MNKFIIVAVLAITVTYVFADEDHKGKGEHLKKMCSNKEKAVGFCECMATNGGMSCDKSECAGNMDTMCAEGVTKEQFKEVKEKCYKVEKDVMKEAFKKCKAEGKNVDDSAE